MFHSFKYADAFLLRFKVNSYPGYACPEILNAEFLKSKIFTEIYYPYKRNSNNIEQNNGITSFLRAETLDAISVGGYLYIF